MGKWLSARPPSESMAGREKPLLRRGLVCQFSQITRLRTPTGKITAGVAIFSGGGELAKKQTIYSLLRPIPAPMARVA